jgi:hypothetical protein
MINKFHPWKFWASSSDRAGACTFGPDDTRIIVDPSLAVPGRFQWASNEFAKKVNCIHRTMNRVSRAPWSIDGHFRIFACPSWTSIELERTKCQITFSVSLISDQSNPKRNDRLYWRNLSLFSRFDFWAKIFQTAG